MTLAEKFYKEICSAFGGSSQVTDEDIGAALHGHRNNGGRYKDLEMDEVAEVIAKNWDENKESVLAKIKAGFEARRKRIHDPKQNGDGYVQEQSL
jgi:hypothetical protein